jgi:hypothetical protein
MRIYGRYGDMKNEALRLYGVGEMMCMKRRREGERSEFSYTKMVLNLDISNLVSAFVEMGGETRSLPGCVI